MSLTAGADLRDEAKCGVGWEMRRAVGYPGNVVELRSYLSYLDQELAAFAACIQGDLKAPIGPLQAVGRSMNWPGTWGRATFGPPPR